MTFKDKAESLLDSGSEVNAMSQVFTFQLDLQVRKTNIRDQKNDGTTLETYGIVVFIFFILDKDDRERFLEENFLLADVRPNILFGISFLTRSNTNVDFQPWDL